MTFEATSDATKCLLSAGMIVLVSGFCALMGYGVTRLCRKEAVLGPGGVLGGIAGMGIGLIATVVLVLDEKWPWSEDTSVTSKCLLSVGIIFLATALCAMMGYISFLPRAGVVLVGISGMGLGMVIAAVEVCGVKWHGYHTG